MSFLKIETASLNLIDAQYEIPPEFHKAQELPVFLQKTENMSLFVCLFVCLFVFRIDLAKKFHINRTSKIK